VLYLGLMTDPPFEEVEHTADWALRVRGGTLPDLFANAARGMYSLLGAERTGDIPVSHTLQLEAPDRETLLVEWLSELLYLTESQNETFDAFAVSDLTATHLEARVTGGPAGPMNKQIKAVTFHDLRIEEAERGYEVTVVFDV